MPESFGELLRTHRLAAGLTQAGLAEEAGLSEQAVSMAPVPAPNAKIRFIAIRIHSTILLVVSFQDGLDAPTGG